MGKTNLVYQSLLIVVLYVSVIVQASLDSERSFNLEQHYSEEEQRAIDWREIEELEELGVRFLDRQERGTCEFKCPGGTVAIFLFIFVPTIQGCLFNIVYMYRIVL